MADGANPRSRTILVVDDDPSICDVFEVALFREGFNIMKLLSGEKVMEMIKKESSVIDLVVLDLMLPGMGGYDILKAMQDSGYPKIPVFVITARMLDKEAVDKIKNESNVKDFWHKPVDIKAFTQRVHEVLGTVPKKSAEKS